MVKTLCGQPLAGEHIARLLSIGRNLLDGPLEKPLIPVGFSGFGIFPSEVTTIRSTLGRLGFACATFLLNTHAS
jgi:hypothetical protein